LAAIATGLTGVIADVWDLNDFWYHTLAGYVMGALAIVHVWLNWGKLAAYARFRLSRRPRVSVQRSPPPVPAPAAASASAPHPSAIDHAPGSGLVRAAGAFALSRRGLIGLSAGAVGGWLFGRGLRPPPVIPQGSDVGVVYHQWSKPGVLDVLGSVAEWGQQPPLYKTYPGAATVSLPPPRLDGGLPTEEAIARRRSVRDYSGELMDRDELSRILFLMSGITTDQWGAAHRTAPSSGALYPIEIYPVVHQVDGVEPGVYHYGFQGHRLELVRPGDMRESVVDQGLMQEYLGQCNLVFFLTMIMQRMRFRYKDRAYRYGLLEAGHIGQNLYLAATSMGLGACAIGAFMDDPINEMLGVDGVEEAAVYMLAAGKV